MIVGYARVSTREQNLDLQIDALSKAGCDRIFSEKVSGVKDRPELFSALEFLRKGDVLVVWKLDRLGRSLKDLITIVDSLSFREIEFKCLIDGIDSSTSIGRCQLAIFGALAQYERDILIERTFAGLEAAKEKGRIGGRKKGLSEDAKKVALAAKKLYELRENSPDEICKLLKISGKPTLYRYLRAVGVEIVPGKRVSFKN
jgi:DNA invertase Pin-like site-specific DNA recombinase